MIIGANIKIQSECKTCKEQLQAIET